jgi:hypothetical protein
VIGPGDSCVDAATLATLAAEACTAQGPFGVTDLSPAFDCADGASSSAKVVCCSL